MLVDAHNDLLLELVVRRGETNPFAEHWLPQLRAGHVALQVCPLFAANVPSETARTTALAQVQAFDRAVHENADVVFAVRTRRDLRALGDGRVALMLSMEGVEAIGDSFATWWDAGVRMVGLTWNYGNAFAGGIDTPTQGLTRRGRALVAELGERGAVLDLAHASAPTFFEALELADDVVVSHAGCRRVHDHARNLSDDQLRALAERDGVLGIMALTLVVGRDAPTLDRLLDHLDHAVDVMGIEHVGLGADFIDHVVAAELAAGIALDPATKEAMDAGGGVLAIAELTGPADYPKLVERLHERGYDADARDAILHANFLRVLDAALPA